MLVVTNPGRIVFPAIGRTKADVVDYYRRIAPRAFPHVEGRLLSLRRYPRGLEGPGFFQKNVPAHYPATIGRHEVPRSRAASRRHRDPEAQKRDVTVYPVLSSPEQLAYVANQGAIELHVPTARLPELLRPDRVIVDLDPPPGALAEVRRAARIVHDALAELGLRTVPVATGSKGYHVVAAIRPTVDAERLAVALLQLATLLATRHPDALTVTFRVADRGGRVFVDWLRNRPLATAVAPYSLRATARATVATPLGWNELEACSPDAFTLDDVERLLDRPDPLAELAGAPADAEPFVAAVDAAFEQAGLVLEPFDRFRSP